MKVKKFSQIFEGGLFDMMWDDGNKNAAYGYGGDKGFKKKRVDKEYTVETQDPIKIVTNDYDDFYKLKSLFHTYKIPFAEKEEILKAEMSAKNN